MRRRSSGRLAGTQRALSVRSACASFLGCPYESSRTSRWRSLCTSRLDQPCRCTTPAGVQMTPAGGPKPFWKGLCVGFSKHMGVRVLATAQIADRRCPATVGRCFGDGRKAVGRRLADSASQAEFNVRPQIASVIGPVGARKAVGRRPLCRLAREMAAFTPASEQRLTPTVRRAGSFALNDASTLKRGRSTAGAEFTRKLRERLNCPSCGRLATRGRLPATDGR